MARIRSMWWGGLTNGTDSADEIIGSTADDLIYAGKGNDYVDAGKGEDTIYAGQGNDTVYGGDGNDVIYGDRSPDGPTPWVPNALQDDYLDGGAGDDRIYGDAGNDRINGGSGSDRIWGGTGDDNMFGGSGTGKDTFYGDAGADTIDGGAGIDTMDYSASTNGVYVNLQRGYGGAATGASSDAAGDTYVNIENVIGTQRHDFLIGDAGDNVLNGGGDNDTLRGGMGADTLDGGDGDADMVDFQTATGGVSVNLLLGYGQFGEAEGDSYRNIEDFYGSVHNDDVVGSSDDNFLDGNDGDDTLLGNPGDDHLIGGEGDDYLEGGTGSDIINGGAGDDELWGDSPLTLATADTFVYRIGDGHDTIHDFGHGADILEIHGADPSLDSHDLVFHLVSGTDDIEVQLNGETLVTLDRGLNTDLSYDQFVFV